MITPPKERVQPQPWIRTTLANGLQLWRHATDAEVKEAAKLGIAVHLLDDATTHDETKE